jgi:hypothetical protein
MRGEPTLPPGGASCSVAVSQLLFAAAMLVMWLLRACCRHVHFACRLPAAGRALQRARSDLRANSPSPSKHVNPAHLFLPVAWRRTVVRADDLCFLAASPLGLPRVSIVPRGVRKCWELLCPSTDFVAHYEITCPRRVLSNTENVTSQIGNFFQNSREVFPKLDATLSHVSNVIQFHLGLPLTLGPLPILMG